MGCCSGNDQYRHHKVKQSEPLQFDKHFRGPLSNRSCTDVICLLIFIVFLACWGVVGYIAIRYGDMDRLLVPTDSQGLKCGVDSEVLHKPYLVFFNLERCIDPLVPINGCPTPQVCVEQCPNATMLFDMNTCAAAGIVAIKEKLICNRDVQINAITTCDQVENLITANQCARWYLKSDSLSKRCIPFNWSQEDFEKLTGYIEMPDLINAIDNIKILANIQGEGQKIVEDVVQSWWAILIGLVIAMVCCLIVIAMMRWLAAPLLWLSILGVIALLAFAIYYSATQYIYLNKNPPTERPNAVTNLSALASNYLQDKTTWLVILIITSVLLIVILLVVLVLRKRIVIAIALVKEGSKAVSSTYSTVFFPIFPWLLQLAVIGFAIVVGLYLASVGNQVHTVVGLAEDSNCLCSGPAVDYKNGELCEPAVFHENCHSSSRRLFNLLLRQGNQNPCEQAACHFRKIESPGFIGWFHAINIVGFFWGVFFIAAFGEMVLAATFATWYWTFHKSDVPFFTLTRGVGRTIRYHLGTLAFGSLILTICRLIRVALEYLDQQCKKYDNAVTKALLCCLKCFFWCLENFIQFLNKNAYIMCAVHGSNFCTSAKDAFNLLMRNFLRVFALDKVTDFLFFLSKVLVTLGMGAITYFYLDSNIYDHKLNYNLVPVVIVMIGTFLISSVFFGVYSMAVDTLFLCFLEDCERNDGSEEKPYFMSKNLMRILGKQNDVSR